MVLEKRICENCGFEDFLIFRFYRDGYYKPFGCLKCKKVINFERNEIKIWKGGIVHCPKCQSSLIDFTGEKENEIFVKTQGNHTCPSCGKTMFKDSGLKF